LLLVSVGSIGCVDLKKKKKESPTIGGNELLKYGGLRGHAPTNSHVWRSVQ
jgi:hypothetical protein